MQNFVKAAKKIEKLMKPDIIDINMGCPVPKVAIKNQAGSALLKDPNKIKEIVSAVVKSVSIPVTVKIRSGWNEENINAVTFIETFYGCSGITSEVPELWISHPDATGTYCYMRCTNAANYADIPADWR